MRHKLITLFLSAVAFIVAFCMSLTVRAQFQAPTDVKARIPNVLLLLDTSGSMYSSLAGGVANCKDELNPTKARYTILGEVLTGTVDDLDCWYNADPLNLGEKYVPLMSNSSRHQTGGQNCVPTLNLQSGILSNLKTYPYGWPFDEADKDDDGAVTYCGARSKTGFQKCFNTNNYVERDKCFKATIGWSQKLDGLLDTYSQKIRFGLMSFDSHSLSGWESYGWYLYRTGAVGSANYWMPEYVGSPITLTASNATCRNLTKGEDRKSTRLNSSHVSESRMPSSA